MLQAWAFKNYFSPLRTYLTHVNDFYWEPNWKLQAEFMTPQNLVAHDLIQHITVNGLRHAGGPVPSLLLHSYDKPITCFGSQVPYFQFFSLCLQKIQEYLAPSKLVEHFKSISPSEQVSMWNMLKFFNCICERGCLWLYLSCVSTVHPNTGQILSMQVLVHYFWEMPIIRQEEPFFYFKQKINKNGFALFLHHKCHGSKPETDVVAMLRKVPRM